MPIPEIIFNMLSRKFHEKFGNSGLPITWSAAPGRVNLIGEHTDYHDGWVFPAAINRYVFAVGCPRRDDVVRIYSNAFMSETSFRYSQAMNPGSDWRVRLEGTLRMLMENVPKPQGMDVLMDSPLPVGGGLSSSAAAQIAVGRLALLFAGIDPAPNLFASLIRMGEHRYAGVNCGIMDPLAVLMGKRDHAYMLDCRSLEGRQIRLPDDWLLVVFDTGVKHELAQSEYNMRQIECGSVVNLIQARRSEIKCLRDVLPQDLDAVAEDADPTALKRCRFVLQENARVHEAVKALQAGDALQVGELFTASHEGLRRDYEVSCTELDLLVDIARQAPGHIASRMTGGGFGGSTVNFVREEDAGDFLDFMTEQYNFRYRMEGTGMIVTASDGERHGGPEDLD